MTTHPQKHPGRVHRRAQARLALRQEPFNAGGNRAQNAAWLRAQVSSGARHMPGSLKGNA